MKLKKQKKKDDQMIKRYKEKFGENIFLMDFFKGLQLVKLMKEWFDETEFMSRNLTRIKKFKRGRRARRDPRMINSRYPIYALPLYTNQQDKIPLLERNLISSS